MCLDLDVFRVFIPSKLGFWIDASDVPDISCKLTVVDNTNEWRRGGHLRRMKPAERKRRGSTLY